MLDKELHSMLKSIIKNKLAFNKLYRDGVYSYSKDDSFVGEVAIINEKALVSFLQDATNELDTVATVDFKDSGTSIYRVNGDNSSFEQYGQDLNNSNGFHTFKAYTPNRDRIIEDISSIKTHCKEKKQAVQTEGKISRLIGSFNLQQKRLSRKEIRELLINTLDKLEKSINKDSKSSRKDISPKVDSVSERPSSNSKTVNSEHSDSTDNIR